MKKSILIWIITVLAFFMICFVIYFVFYVPKLKQSNKHIERKEELKNLEQKILFYENDGNANKILESLYDESSEESLRLLLLSLKMLPASDKKPLWVARAYHLIAYCYNERKEWQKSAEYGQKCLELSL